MAILPLKQRPQLGCVKTTQLGRLPAAFPLLPPLLPRFFRAPLPLLTSGARRPLFASHSETTIVDGMQDAFSPKASERANKVTEFHAGPARRAGPTAGDAAPPVTRQ